MVEVISHRCIEVILRNEASKHAADSNPIDTHHFVCERVAHSKTLKIQFGGRLGIVVQDGFGQSGDIVAGVPECMPV